MVKVVIIERERGWGSRIDETKEFPDKVSAQTFVNEYNSKNPMGFAPDWYMQAEIVEE